MSCVWLKVNDLHFAYNSKKVLDGITFELKAGKLLAVLGTNGSGKSTLLKNLNMSLEPKGGSVFVEGCCIKRMSRKEIAKKIGYLPQKSNAISCTVFEAVLLGRKPHISWNLTEADISKTHETLALTGLNEYADRDVMKLSGGELQRVMIARAINQEPKILLLDEPINHLDIKHQIEIMQLIKKLTIELTLITIIVMHDLSSALRFSDQFLMLRQGKVFNFGEKNIMTPKNIKQVYDIDVMLHDMGNDIVAVLPYM